jgi:hypothetical protein
MRTRDLHLHHRLRHRFFLRLTLLVLFAVAGPARAQEAGPAAAPAAEPDTAGEDARARAERLFAEGNELLGKYRLARAVEKYRQALEHWDHPVIHFNLAKAL